MTQIMSLRNLAPEIQERKTMPLAPSTASRIGRLTLLTKCLSGRDKRRTGARQVSVFTPNGQHPGRRCRVSPCARSPYYGHF
jgi:hypothetical protein